MYSPKCPKFSVNKIPTSKNFYILTMALTNSSLKKKKKGNVGWQCSLVGRMFAQHTENSMSDPQHHIKQAQQHMLVILALRSKVQHEIHETFYLKKGVRELGRQLGKLLVSQTKFSSTEVPGKDTPVMIHITFEVQTFYA